MIIKFVKYSNIRKGKSLFNQNKYYYDIKIFINKYPMASNKPLFKAPYNFKDVGVLFGLVAILLIISALLGNYLFGIFQDSFF